ncbi:sensor histidine kinase [Sulfuricurvum sp.]|uniref:sensor histidine kinase n=1 Tax=Sulfuricurvum sp. TaxID=2025608 RepID=UPI003BB5E4F0
MADSDAAQWKKRFERERSARKSAEKLLEDKSLEIWEINQALEQMIEERTVELQEALIAAEAANKAKDAFLSSMSHELRTPLNAIIGFSQILMSKSDTNENAKGFIEKIQVAGKTLLSIVNTVLDFSKIESGKMDYSPESFPILKLLQEIETIIEPLLLKKKLSLEIESDVEEMIADFYLLKQALINLLSNAIKFSPQSGKIRLECCKDEYSNAVILRVIDHGNGIEQEKIHTLFQPFSQLANARYIEEIGTGLGLMIIKKIADLHQGEVNIKNNASGGATFWIVIPQPAMCRLKLDNT